jgi:hypothetical protein
MSMDTQSKYVILTAFLQQQWLTRMFLNVTVTLNFACCVCFKLTGKDNLHTFLYFIWLCL